MKKRTLWTVFATAAIMLIVLIGTAGAASSEVGITFLLSTNKPAAGETIQADISLTNNLGYDLPTDLILYDPAGKELKNYGPLKAGDKVKWKGKWTVTEKQIEEGRITFTVRYALREKDGRIQKKAVHFSKKIEKESPMAIPAPAPTPTVAPENRSRVIAFSVMLPNPGTGRARLTCLDRDGTLWTNEQWEYTWPYSSEEALQAVIERRGMKEYALNQEFSGILGNLNEDEANSSGVWRDLVSLADTVMPGTEMAQKTGIDDGAEYIYAVRKNQDGDMEAVLLGVAGSRVYENTDPAAKTMYQFMWRILRGTEFGSDWPVFGYAAQPVAPRGESMVSVKEFFHLKDFNAEELKVTAVMTDCEEGLIPVQMTEEDAERIRVLADRGVVIGKHDSWVVTGGTTIYDLRDAAGNEIGQIETSEHDSLAVAADGMYQLSILPPSTEALSAEEREMLTIRIDGTDYLIGQSTPRDLINNGWYCYIEWDGTYSFWDSGRYGVIYARTAGGGVDEPIMSFTTERIDEVISISYGSFDGKVVADDPNDQDTRFWKLMTLAGVTNITAEETAAEPWWDGMHYWIKGLGEKKEDEVGNVTVSRPLSNGTMLYIGTNPVSLDLFDEYARVKATEPED